MTNSMNMMLVLIKNTTSTKVNGITGSHVSIQVRLIDAWVYSDDSAVAPAPASVIVIAVVVGGLITGVCVTAIVCIVLKAIRKKKDGDVTELGDEDIPSSERRRRTRLDQRDHL